jgi:hypothetical protein
MKSFACIIFVIISLRIVAQDYPREQIDISEIADELYGLPDADLNYEELYENLVQLFSEPIDLNAATKEELRSIKIISEAQIESLINYRSQNGPLLSVYELQSVPDFDLTVIYNLVPFVTVRDASQALNLSFLNRIRSEGENYLLIRYERTLESKKGFTATDESSKFTGSPDKLYLRFRNSKAGDFSMGFTAEKDAGEEIKWNPGERYYGADFLSGHFHIMNKGRLKNLVIGDFQTQFGQGIMLGGMFGTGKGSETITGGRRSNLGVLPYTSSNEAGAMRGIGVAIQASKHMTVTGFYSGMKKDASQATDGQEEIISGFQTSGLHRNERELATRKSSGEKNIGAVIQYRLKSLDAGIMFNQVTFDAPLRRRPSAYNQFMFQGSANRNIGFYANYAFHNAAFFFEAAHSINGGLAATVGLLSSLAPGFDLSIIYRKYARNFYSLYTSAFGESSGAQNETGIYCGWKYLFNRRFNISGYADYFKFPWLKFRVYAPSTGHEWLLRFGWEPSRKIKLYLQAREEFKARNIESDDATLYQTKNGTKRNFLLSLDCTTHPMLRLKNRAQFSTYTINKKSTSGFSLIQDVILDVGKLKFTMRYALFDTDDYDNRQYTYENDVWLAYSLPAYAGSGIRKMLMVQYKINKHISCWIRYGHVRYNGQDSIGSGADEIESDKKNDIKVQVVVRI